MFEMNDAVLEDVVIPGTVSILRSKRPFNRPHQVVSSLRQDALMQATALSDMRGQSANTSVDNFQVEARNHCE